MTEPSVAEWRRVAIWALPAAVTAIWLSTVVAGDHLDRIANVWQSTVTMIFGSFVAGSTPQGGGAVAFPVFTKVLEVPTPVARTFSLSVQAIGMTTASAIILLAGRTIDRRAVIAAGGGGITGFLFGLFVLSDPSAPFWPSKMSAPYVKVTFTVMLAAMSYIVFLSLRAKTRGTHSIQEWNMRVWTGLIAAGFIGGIASAFTGSGVDVLLFLFAVVMCGLHPRVGVPSSIIAMAGTSLLGFIVLGLVNGQLSVGLNELGQVVSVGTSQLDAMPARQYDVFGLWMAAVPVIVWGAPLGTFVAHIMTERRLITFVAAMAALEVFSTIVFLDALRTDYSLVIFGALGLAVAIGAVRYMSLRRFSILGLSDEIDEKV